MRAVTGELYRNGVAADAAHLFPHDSVRLLLDAGVGRAPLPGSVGGDDLDSGSLVRLVSTVAAADPGLGLVTAMHVVHARRVFADTAGSASLAAAAEAVVAGAGFVSSLVSENRSIAPARGGAVRAQAVPTDGGWLLRTRKRYATGIRALSHAVVAATIDGENTLRHFLVHIDPDTTRIERTWDVLGLRTSGSDDIIFEDTFVPSDSLLPPEVVSQSSPWWSLVLAGLYAGIAEGAFRLVTDGSLPTQADGAAPADVPRVRGYTGESGLALLTVRSLVDTAVRRHIDGALTADEAAAVKLATHRNATTVLDQVGRAFGTASVWQTHAWQRYFRDLRVGAHNSPSEDHTIDALARQILTADRPVA
ncbi:acyl-CoA dehydrogenase family protein [Rhodococcus sp. YH1]|uniref:acyl-CoA dehydrogenase family protein n=1 Tax=Rhodococcus sp. YH1 TaxID=89066 RepID=UPI001386B853